MQHWQYYILAVLFICLNITRGQLVDPILCPNGSTLTLDNRWPQPSSLVEIITEFIQGNALAEVSQVFSTEREVLIITTPQGIIKSYRNFNTNEIFTILSAVMNGSAEEVCARSVLDSSSETSALTKGLNILKPSALIGYDTRNQRNTRWGVQFDGQDNVRGFPAYRFKSCFYVDDMNATVSATYYTSNSNALLRIDVNIVDQLSRRDSYTYNIYRYVPNLTYARGREVLETPEGVYCPGRTSTVPLPQNLPTIISENSESILSMFVPEISSVRTLYDTENRLGFFNYWYTSTSKERYLQPVSEIHDFATGINYKFNPLTGQCNAIDLSFTNTASDVVSVKPNIVQMGSMEHVFLIDNFTYQYTGERLCGIETYCHTWVSKKDTSNITVEYRQWYWASRIKNQALTNWFPVKLIVKGYMNFKLSYIAESHIFDFRRLSDSTNGMDHMLANCYHALGTEEGFNLGVIFFVLANDDEHPVEQNINLLRNALWEALALFLQVRPIRISNIIIDRDGKDVLVTFTLLDTPPRFGPVETPLKEPSLMNAIENLGKIINVNGFVVQAKYDNQKMSLRGRINSLQIISTSFNRTNSGCTVETSLRSLQVDECTEATIDTNLDQNIEIDYKGSGPLITGLYIGFIVFGLLIGTIGGVFTVKRCSKSQ